MKKLAIALAALAVAATVASAAVYSQNAVGFINVEIAANELVPLTVPFDVLGSEDGTILFKDTELAKAAQRGSVAYFWRNQGWKPVNALPTGGFNTTEVLQPGECFFFKPSQAQTYTLSGEVPSDGSISVSISGKGNLNAVGNPYPVSQAFKETALAQSAKRGAIAYFWKEEGGWNPANALPSGGFNTSKILQPGEGFFYKSATTEESGQWTESKPYEYP